MYKAAVFQPILGPVTLVTVHRVIWHAIVLLSVSWSIFRIPKFIYWWNRSELLHAINWSGLARSGFHSSAHHLYYQAVGPDFKFVECKLTIYPSN